MSVQGAVEKTPAETGLAWGSAGGTRADRLRRQFPTVEDLRRRARRRIPRFSFEYLDGGAGLDAGVERNVAAFGAVEIVPRYGIDVATVTTDVDLFGRRYAAPIGISPMGLPSLIWPGGEGYLARAAQNARVPYTLGTVAGLEIERAATLAPDVLWFQLYRLPGNDHAVAFDLIRRAEEAGAHVLVVTIDVPQRSKRPRELRNALVIPFRLTARNVYEAATSPAWLAALWRNGSPRFANFSPYVRGKGTPGEIAGFVQREVRGGFTWEEIARIRDHWSGPLVVKGIMHPADAAQAVALGADGILVSNHGGRQLEGAPAAIDVLPAIVRQVDHKATVLMDSGVRCGLDIVRAIALGAAAAFAGRPFGFALAALGEEGPGYVAALLIEETEAALRQVGAPHPAHARSLVIRHRGAMEFPVAQA
jgi:L-lactate dehydrogenase (cytochrome)